MTPELHKTLKCAIELLPDEWIITDISKAPFTQITRLADGLCFSISDDSYNHRGKIHISYSSGGVSKNEWYITVYDDKHDKVSYPSINIDMKKDAETIAKDILRRIMKDAEYVLVIKKLKEDEAFATGKEMAIKIIAHDCGTEPEKHYQTGELTGEIRPYTKGQDFKKLGYGSFVVNGPNSISLKLESMSLVTADLLAKAFKKIIADQS